MSDIVEDLMLRRADGTLFNPSGPTAADEIARLRAEVERLTEGREMMGNLWAREKQVRHEAEATIERLTAALKMFACDCEGADLCKFPHACVSYVARAAITGEERVDE